MKFLCLMAQNNTVYFKPKDIKDGNCSLLMASCTAPSVVKKLVAFASP